MTKSKSKQRGRPTKDDATARRVNITVRATHELKARVAAKMAEKDWSETRVVEAALRQYLSQSDTLEFSEHVNALAMLIGLAVSEVEEFTGNSWQKDRFTYEEARRAIFELCDEYAPKGNSNPPLLLANTPWSEPGNIALGVTTRLKVKLSHDSKSPTRIEARMRRERSANSDGRVPAYSADAWLIPRISKSLTADRKKREIASSITGAYETEQNQQAAAKQRQKARAALQRRKSQAGDKRS